VPTRPAPRRRRAGLALAAVLFLLGLALWAAREPDAPPDVARAARAPAPGAMPFFGPVPADMPAPQNRRQLLANLQLAERTYCSYRAASRYPPGSRPMLENADQDRPNDPAVSTDPMRLDGDASDDTVRLQTSQSRVYLGAGESAAFTLRAIDAEGRTLPLEIDGAFAQGLGQGGQASRTALQFADDGGAPDAAANDGTFSGALDPARGSLARVEGTIRTEVGYQVNGKHGVLQFDVIHTPQLPAVWAGPVRAAVEQGSLNFYLPLDVRQGGRYLVSGRADDARGQSFALLSFNEVLKPGPNEVKLVAFGKLVRDGQPALPLSLRDVEGYLLKDAGDPDRALLPRLEGKVATSPAQDAAGFSNAEWQSEQKSRYLAEFARDLTDARARLAAADPAAALPPGACTLPAARP